MKHILFAVFDGPDAAERAIRELRTQAVDVPSGDSRKVLAPRVTLHGQDLPQTELSIECTNAREGLFRGLAIGILFGAIAGALLAFVLDRTGFGGGPATALFAALGGAICGALGGALMGSADPDHELDGLASGLRAGQVLVSIEVDDMRLEDEAEKTLTRCGATVRHKRVA